MRTSGELEMLNRELNKFRQFQDQLESTSDDHQDLVQETMSPFLNMIVPYLGHDRTQRRRGTIKTAVVMKQSTMPMHDTSN